MTNNIDKKAKALLEKLPVLTDKVLTNKNESVFSSDFISLNFVRVNKGIIILHNLALIDSPSFHSALLHLQDDTKPDRKNSTIPPLDFYDSVLKLPLLFPMVPK